MGVSVYKDGFPTLILISIPEMYLCGAIIDNSI